MAVYKVKLSTYSVIISTVCLCILIYILWVVRERPFEFFTVLALTLFMVISALLYGPYKVEVTDGGLRYRSPAKSREINFKDIADIRPFQPTMGAMRLIGSGGFMGHYGLYREGDIGRYFASYGKSSDCFLVTLKDGRNIVLGCDNPLALVKEVRSKLE